MAWAGEELGQAGECMQSSGSLICQPAQRTSTLDNGNTGANGLTSAVGWAQGQRSINTRGAELSASPDMLGF